MAPLTASVFKAYDVRGLYPSEVTADLFQQLGRAFVAFLGPGTYAVSRDMRTSSPELADAFAFLRDIRPVSLNKIARKAMSEDGRSRLAGLREKLAEAEVWNAQTLSEIIALYCNAQSLSMGQVGQPLRAALTGGLPAPDIAPVLAWLGKDEALARIDDQLIPSVK